MGDPAGDAGVAEGPAGRPTSPRKLRKTAQIMSAARAVFFQNGFDTASMDAIARRAGVSKATLYTNFADKNDLFVRMIEADCRSFADSMADPIDANATAETALTELASRYVKFLLREEGIKFYRTVVSHAAKFPEVGRLFYEAGPKVVTERVAAFLQEAGGRGLLHLSDPTMAAVHLLSLVRADLLLTADLLGMVPPADEVDRVIESGVQIFLAYYGAKRP